MYSLFKDVTLETIRRIPEDATAEDMIYEIYYVDRHLEDVKEKENFHRFINLAGKWKEETKLSSFTGDIVQHPAYLEIIGMGEKVIPYILRDLASKPSHWFIALRSITGISPIKTSHKGDITKMSEDWVAWGKEHGYI